MKIAEQATLLKGIRVLDLCQYVPGPYASLKMRNLGAEIIKVEPPGGDPMRKLSSEGGEVSRLYQHLNRGKTIVEINLKSKTGSAQLTQLLSSANVLLDGFRPGVLERLGFSHAALHTINSKLIICNLSGFGQQGKNRQRAGHDLGYAARAGLYTCHAEKARPQLIFPPAADHAAALETLGCVCAALYQQEKTGLGCVLDLGISNVVADWQYMFEEETVVSQLSGALACYNVYQVKDGRYITLSALEPKFWIAFCTRVNRPDWVLKQSEVMPQNDLIDEVSELFMSRTLGEWELTLMDVDCCFEPVVLREEIARCLESVSRASNSIKPELQWVAAENIRWSSE